MTTYTVKAGNSLSSIARDVLGNRMLWPQIAARNHIGAPYRIYPGQVLTLPARTGELLPAPALLPVATPGLVAWLKTHRLLIGGAAIVAGALGYFVWSRHE